MAVLPTLVLVVWGMGLLLLDLVVPRERKSAVAWLALLGMGVAFVAGLSRWGRPLNGFDDAVRLDNYGLFLSSIVIIAGMLTVLLSLPYLRERGEYDVLLLFSLGGMTLVSSANDLTVLFIALELMSIPLYVLVGLTRPWADGEARASEESALKHFLLGAFASAFLIYGIALVYGGVGATSLPKIALGITDGNLTLTLVGAGFVLVGLAFKVAAVPFHMWAPDVYEGAPGPVAGFMSVALKTAGFAALGRVFVLALPALRDDWTPVVAALAALTMILGNVVALSQDNVKRMLAYSSIAHTGYVLIGVAACSERGLAAMLFYLLAYALTKLGAFAALIAVARYNFSYAGLARREPWLAAAMALFMFSLTGMPPTGGFVGKYYVFWAAVEADLFWLAVLGVLTSLVSAVFYLRVVTTMYFDAPPHDEAPFLSHHPALLAVLVLTAAGTLILGLWPGPLLEMLQNSVWITF